MSKVMNMFSVDIVSYETIKPSSPTPPHLNTLLLSAMDQHEEPLYFHGFLFYSAPARRDAIAARLKKSLSATLTLFYPFAGRIADDSKYVDCNDRGVNLFESRVNTQMARVLSDPTSDDLAHFVPNHHKLDPTALLSIQINLFDCGGVALGVCLTHQICDPSSMAFFLNAWATVTRGAANETTVRPVFSAPSLFPPADLEVPPMISPPTGTKSYIVSKRFVFSASNIAALQAQCSNKSYRPTRVEAVSAYMWKCVMNAAGATSSGLLHSLNLRTRMDPPLSNSAIGNFVLGLLAMSTTRTSPALPDLAAQLHESIIKIDSNFVRELQVDNGILKLYDSYKKVMAEPSSQGDPMRYFVLSSFCRFPFYEADFGWGKPEWVTLLNLAVPDVTWLMDTKCGTGIQVWVTLNEQLMSRLECNPNYCEL